MVENQRRKIALTGIKPSGEPHLGNYVGAIRPALELARTADFDSRYFIADEHALTGTPAAGDIAAAVLFAT